jgi:antitoxin StbD
MTQIIFTEVTASITELQQNPLETVSAGNGLPVAIFDHNQPAFYCIPVAAYQALLEKIEDLELNALADKRLNDGQALIKVSLDKL